MPNLEKENTGGWWYRIALENLMREGLTVDDALEQLLQQGRGAEDHGLHSDNYQAEARAIKKETEDNGGKYNYQYLPPVDAPK